MGIGSRREKAVLPKFHVPNISWVSALGGPCATYGGYKDEQSSYFTLKVLPSSMEGVTDTACQLAIWELSNVQTQEPDQNLNSSPATY